MLPDVTHAAPRAEPVRPRRPELVGSTDERVHAFLVSQGPSTIVQVCEALRLGHVSGAMSLDRLRLAGAARTGVVQHGTPDVWEATSTAGAGAPEQLRQ